MARGKSVGCTLMVGFMLVGLILAGVGFFLVLLPELEVKRKFVGGNCVILGKEIVEGTSSRRRKTGYRKKIVYRPEFRIRYEVGGKAYTASTYRINKESSSSKSWAQDILDEYTVGENYPCWYDPADPSRVVLEKGLTFASVAIMGLGVVFVLVGAFGGSTAFFRR